jgi:hypothetical protein
MPHAASLSLFPLPGLIAVINPTDPRPGLPKRVIPAMSMKESRAAELAIDVGSIRKLVIRIVTAPRTADIDAEEWEALQRLGDLETDLTEKAEDELLAIGLFRRSRRSDHVQRLARQILPDPDSAA